MVHVSLNSVLNHGLCQGGRYWDLNPMQSRRIEEDLVKSQNQTMNETDFDHNFHEPMSVTERSHVRNGLCFREALIGMEGEGLLSDSWSVFPELWIVPLRLPRNCSQQNPLGHGGSKQKVCHREVWQKPIQITKLYF